MLSPGPDPSTGGAPWSKHSRSRTEAGLRSACCPELAMGSSERRVTVADVRADSVRMANGVGLLTAAASALSGASPPWHGAVGVMQPQKRAV